MILTGERGLQGSWLSTVNCNPREGHHKSFQFVTYILRRNFRSEWDVSRCCYDCPKCHHPESWVWWQDAFSQSEVRVITRWPMRSSPTSPRILGLVTCDVWHMGGVSRDRGAWHRVTVLTGATYQLLLQADWLTADKCFILLADKKRRSRGSQVRCEERSEWRVNILNNLTLISLNQSLLHLELKEFWRFANKKLIWCLPWPIRDHSRVIILVSGLIWIKANLDGVEEQEEAMREAFAFSFNWSQARFVAFFSL